MIHVRIIGALAFEEFFAGRPIAYSRYRDLQPLRAADF